MISRKKILLFTIIELLFFLKISNVFAISRNAVMDNAEVYKNFIWNCSSNNVYDVYLNTSIPAGIIFNPNNPPDGAVEGKDYIDDRMGNIRDVNNDGIIDTKDITSTNLSNWPYYINTTTAPFVGEAYAWGYGHHLTNAHKPNITPYNYKSFEEYLSEGRISGARKGDPSNDYGTDTRFTGLDCSGFVTRCWNIPRYHQGTGQLSEWSKNIDINDLKSGDILNKVGLHTIIFKDWIEKPAKAKIIHATADRFKYNEHIRRVIEDEVMISQIADYIPYSPFPIFSNITPSSSTIMNIITPTIQITIQSGPQTGDNFNKVISTSVYIIIDKDTENERIVPNTALTKTPTTNSKSLVITYNVPEANPLSEGEHTIYVYAQNELNLEDDNTDKLHLFTIDTTPPEWAGTFDNIDKETNPGNLILAKTQGGNNFDYVYTCDALPDEVGWQRVSYKGTPTIAIENGQLRIETKYRDAFDRDGVTYWKSCENEPISWTDNFTLEYKLNIDNFNNTSNLWFRGACWYGSTIITYYWDDYSGYEVWYNNDILSYNFMSAHIYRVVFRNEGGTEKMDLYIDGEKKATHEHSFGAFGFEIACNSDVTMLMDYF